MLIGLLSVALAQECSLEEPPGNVQVAWITPIRKQVRANAEIEVVRIDQLAGFVHDNKADQTRVLQALGMAGKRGGWRARRLYKVVVFETTASELCRPGDHIEGDVIAGARACGSGRSGCTQDKLTDAPGLEVYRLSWRDAARWGFCVVPLEVYLNEI